MSNPEGRTKQGLHVVQGFGPLEKAVDGTLSRLEELRVRLQKAEEQGKDMDELLRKFTGEDEDPAQLLARLRSLESENLELLDRLQKGREGVERLLARIRFLEEQG